MKKTTCLAGICLTASLLTGCNESNDFTPVSGMDGMDIYASACANCHGENGTGLFGLFLKLAGSDAPAEEIVGMIQKGGHIMPAFPNIDEQQAKLVATYLKSL
ncbi:MAG: cytochrome c [Candidatus Thiodiazotropha sp.]|jgi:mono/diheme cytochrome c family protein